jgi:tetratricopeptide (TPR) repeat protein
MPKPVTSPAAPLVLGAISLLLFALSALSGFLVAYDRAVALEKFVALAAGLGLVLLVAAVGRLDVRWVFPTALICVLLILCGVVLLQPEQFHVSELAEPLIILVPLGVGCAIACQPQATTARLWLYTGCLLLAGVYLLWLREGSSGGALLAGGAAMMLAAAGAGDRPQWRMPAKTLGILLGGAGAVIVVGYLWLLFSSSAAESLAGWLPSQVLTRLHRYHDYLAVVQDYLFTGSGLGVSAMVYSTYLFLVHVPFTSQAHNLFIQLAVEQGIPGLVAFAGLLIAAGWALRLPLRDGEQGLRLSSAVALGALVTLAINGLLDADIYDTHLAALLLTPIGVAWGLYFAAIEATEVRGGLAGGIGADWSGVIGLTPLVMLAGLLLWPQGQAALYANAGAVAQTKTELSVYEWPSWALQDQVRRGQAEQLRAAVHFYNTSLARDPENVTAHWRLGQLALADGEYTAAEEHLEMAYAADPSRRAVRQLLGEVYAVNGQVDQALAMWAPLNTNQDQLLLREWWYESIGDLERFRRLQEAALDYENSTLRYSD